MQPGSHGTARLRLAARGPERSRLAEARPTIRGGVPMQPSARRAGLRYSGTAADPAQQRRPILMARASQAVRPPRPPPPPPPRRPTPQPAESPVWPASRAPALQLAPNGPGITTAWSSSVRRLRQPPPQPQHTLGINHHSRGACMRGRTRPGQQSPTESGSGGRRSGHRRSGGSQRPERR